MMRADDYLTKPFNARALLVRANMQYVELVLADIRLQMGRERRHLEHLFEDRTQELRLLSDSELNCDLY